MFNPPQPPRSRISAATIVLILCVLAAGAGIVYLFTAEEKPAWLSSLLPSSSSSPTDQDKGDGGKTDGSAKGPGIVKVATPPSGAKVARPPGSPDAGADADSQAPAGEGQLSLLPDGSRDSPQPVITYDKAKPVGPNATMVRGQIPDGQSASGLVPADAAGQQPGPGVPAKDDKVVPFPLLEDMAKFLAANFWPQGSHPLARNGAITTATVKWANVKYGAQAQGFGVTGPDAAYKRKSALDYLFTPGVIETLYNTYAQRFFDAFDREARSQVRGADKKVLNSAELGDMYDVYAVACQNLVEAMYAYIYTPNVRGMVAEYTETATEAAEAYKHFASSLQNGSGSNVQIARRYQKAILERDKKRDVLAAALYKQGATRNMDADSLAYLAQWLYRRGPNANPSLTALANIIHSSALTFRAIGAQYDDMAYTQGLR